MYISKNLVRRIGMMCVGVFILGVAVSLSVYAHLGSDPGTCMNLGVSQQVGLSFGVWQLLLNCIILIFMFIFSRHLIGIGTVVNMTCIGFLADFLKSIYARILPAEPAVAARILIMAFAVVLLAFGAALYIYPRLGISPYDSIGFIFAERLHIQFRWCRITCDVLAVLIGFLCGSVVGVGTVFTAFCMGPLIKGFGDLIAKKFPLQFD